MQLTRAADYAVRVMIHLAGLPAGTRVSRSELSAAAECPEQLVGARSAPGCAAPERVREHADQVRAAIAKAAQWRQARRTVIDDAEHDLLETAGRLVPTRPA